MEVWWDVVGTEVGVWGSGSCTRFWKLSAGQLQGRELKPTQLGRINQGPNSFHIQKMAILGVNGKGQVKIRAWSLSWPAAGLLLSSVTWTLR